MKTKTQIVQELLDKKVITAEDAVVLLMEGNSIQYVPYYPLPTWAPNPWQPIPWTPPWQSPFVTIS